MYSDSNPPVYDLSRRNFTQNFYPEKIYLPQPGLKMQTLGLLASTLLWDSTQLYKGQRKPSNYVRVPICGKTIILPIVLYGCEIWFLTLMEERRLRVFENWILRQILGSKRVENDKWRMFYNEEPHSLYCSSNIVRMIKSRRFRWSGHIIAKKSTFKILTGKPRGKRFLVRSRHGREDIIRIVVEVLGIYTRNWIDSTQPRDYWRSIVKEEFNFRINKPWS